MRTKEQTREYRLKHLEKFREYQKKYRETHKESVTEYNAKWHRDHPEATKRANSQANKKWRSKNYVPHPKIRLKYLTSEEQSLKRKARVTTQTRIKQGILKKCPCEVCGTAMVEAHHPDYSKPLDVKWLCRKHHLEIHRTAKL
jgi:hypothetical protein